jgi:redox-sensitive bicupin YhaK (pirin superfamily)
VNLFAKDKMTQPGYQSILNADIPRVLLQGAAGEARVIAGTFGGVIGAAETFSPMQVIDLSVKAGQSVRLQVNEGWNTALVVLSGNVRINAEHAAHEAQLVVLSPEGDVLTLETETDVKALLLSGQALNEPIVGHGPFVMNTAEEIRQAIVDFNNGQFGQMAR